MKTLLADFHIHSALSPCAGDDMTPPAIVRWALDRSLALIAICDHNSAANSAAVQQAAGDRLAVLAGMEITTAEEAHVLGIFPDAASASSAAAELLATLPEADERYYRKFGNQFRMDAAGTVVSCEKKMLAMATTFPLSETIGLVKRYGGLTIASHVDRPSYSVIRQLGFFPTDAGFDAVEISPIAAEAHRAKEFIRFGLPVVTSSDAHQLADIGTSRTALKVEAAAFGELVLALQGVAGRRLFCA